MGFFTVFSPFERHFLGGGNTNVTSYSTIILGRQQAVNSASCNFLPVATAICEWTAAEHHATLYRGYGSDEGGGSSAAVGANQVGILKFSELGWL